MRINRRTFLQATAGGALLSQQAPGQSPGNGGRKLNLVYVFGDQWRAQALGYAGDPNVHTPNIDALAKRSVNMVNAVAGSPVCSPYRATLMTGQYPLTHGVFLNDVQLRPEAVSIADVFNDAGYQTAYIGKWHIDGRGRSAFIPEERRQGFEFWRVLECTHNYNHSKYFGDEPPAKVWDGYDVFAQTDEAIRYLKEERDDRPFALFLSWGPPHDPYQTAPERYNDQYDPAALTLPPNVPQEAEEWARRDLAGYYAHCTALDTALGQLMRSLEEQGLMDDTLFVFTSDHGDMLGSQGQRKKQKPWDESIRVPMLLHSPALWGGEGRELTYPIDSVEIMPTILELCGVNAPETCEVASRADYLLGGPKPDDVPLLACYAPFGEWKRANGGKEFRGVRTERYTYVRDMEGPWLLYDNQEDPYQQQNLVGTAERAELQKELDARLQHKLAAVGDEFLHGDAYIAQWGHTVDESGTVPYTP